MLSIIIEIYIPGILCVYMENKNSLWKDVWLNILT